MSEPIVLSDIIADIESRQDDVLKRLDALNSLVEKTIAEWLGPLRVISPDTNRTPDVDSLADTLLGTDKKCFAS